MNDELIDYLKNLAFPQDDSYDDPSYSAYDYCGGNFDDAYYNGREHGKIALARRLLIMLDKTN